MTLNRTYQTILRLNKTQTVQGSYLNTNINKPARASKLAEKVQQKPTSRHCHRPSP